MAGVKTHNARMSRRNLPSRMKMLGYKKQFVEFAIDPELAMRKLPAGTSLQTGPGGKACLLIMIQEWDRCILDGFLPIKKIRMSHIWIELNGPKVNYNT
jgi:hypothetical protein